MLLEWNEWVAQRGTGQFPGWDRRDAAHTVLEASRGGWYWHEVGEVPYRASGSELHLAIPRSMLGHHAEGQLTIGFKWSDNMQVDGDIMDFYIHGDTAPYGRFSFLYTEDPRLTSPPES